MKISTLINYAGGFKEAVAEIKDLEQAGLDVVWVPEAYSFDAPSAMGYLAAQTQRVTIASGILPIYSRTPSLLAMTAAGIDYLSDGRAMLGLGASGPQVIEGFHGVPYVAPVARTREVIEICRQVWRREKVQHMGDHYQIPLPQDRGTGLGKPLKLINHPVRSDIPIAIASLGPTSVAATAELADAWLPAFYTAEAAEAVWGDSLRKGAKLRDSSRAPLDVYAGGTVAIGDGTEPLRDRGRPGAALYVGGMGAKDRNFHKELIGRMGFEGEAEKIQELYLAGKKQEAAMAVPDALADEISLVGPVDKIRDRLQAWDETPVTSINVSARSTAELETLAQLVLNR